jgi:hypothetical protein
MNVVPMATQPFESDTLSLIMQWSSAVFLLLITLAPLVVAILLFRKAYKHKKNKQHPKGIGPGVISLGIFFVASSVYAFVSIGPLLGLALSEQAGLPYILPSALSFGMLCAGIAVVVVGVLLALLLRLPKPTIAEKKDAAARHQQTPGTTTSPVGA